MTAPHPLTQSVDWDAVTAEAVELLSAYLQIDSAHPRGRTVETAQLLGARLEAEGIPTRLYESEVEGKVNLLGRLSSPAPTERPLVLSNHMDVVQAVAADWSFDPYSGAVANGYVYGRGALDMKGMGVMELMAVLLLRRLRVPLDRDVLLLCTCDEEIGSVNGAQWLVANHFADIDPGLLLDEGGTGMHGFFQAGDVFAVSVAEKRAVRIRMIARAEPGHASQPWADAATHRLVRAAHAVLTQTPEDRACAPVAELIRRLGGESARAELAASRATAPLLHDTISMTMLSGGYKINVLPEEAEMRFDCRILPDTDPRAFVSNLKQTINDPDIHLEVSYPDAHAHTSGWAANPLFTAISAACSAYAPRAIVSPSVCVGGTDARYFRERGVDALGLVPGLFSADDLKGFHGVDERLSISNLRLGTQIVFDIAARIVAP